MSVYNDIAALNEALAGETLTEMVKTWANCTSAEISPDGDVWIAHPQRSHWLPLDELVKFAVWAGAQDLDDWQDRCNPDWAASKRRVSQNP